MRGLMRRAAVVTGAALLLLGPAVGAASAAGGAAGSSWGTAREVPGTAALNAGGDAATLSLSCASAGNCSAGGFYADSSDNLQAFVVNEVSGIWRTAKKVVGTAALNSGGPSGAQVLSVSCAPAAKCSAGGFYTDSSESPQAFVVGQN